MRRWVLVIDKWKVRAELDGARTREPATVDGRGEAPDVAQTRIPGMTVAEVARRTR